MMLVSEMRVRNIILVIFSNLVKYDLPPGDYRFEWVYTYKVVPGYKIGADIKWIEFEGMTDGQFECEKCDYGYSNEGAEDCKRCDAFTYFNPQNQTVFYF